MKVADLKKLIDGYHDDVNVCFNTPLGWVSHIDKFECYVSRFVLVDNQVMCGYPEVVCLIDGWHSTSTDALASVGYSNECFSAKELEFTRTPLSFVKE